MWQVVKVDKLSITNLASHYPLVTTSRYPLVDIIITIILLLLRLLGLKKSKFKLLLL